MRGEDGWQHSPPPGCLASRPRFVRPRGALNLGSFIYKMSVTIQATLSIQEILSAPRPLLFEQLLQSERKISGIISSKNILEHLFV